MRKYVIKWPSATERQEISAKFTREFGLAGAVCIVDSTPAVFSLKAAVDGSTFFTRKCHYASNMQLVCDCNSRILYNGLDWPGITYQYRFFYLFKHSSAIIL